MATAETPDHHPRLSQLRHNRGADAASVPPPYAGGGGRVCTPAVYLEIGRYFALLPSLVKLHHLESMSFVKVYTLG